MTNVCYKVLSECDSEGYRNNILGKGGCEAWVVSAETADVPADGGCVDKVTVNDFETKDDIEKWLKDNGFIYLCSTRSIVGNKEIWIAANGCILSFIDDTAYAAGMNSQRHFDISNCDAIISGEYVSKYFDNSTPLNDIIDYVSKCEFPLKYYDGYFRLLVRYDTHLFPDGTYMAPLEFVLNTLSRPNLDGSKIANSLLEIAQDEFDAEAERASSVSVNVGDSVIRINVGGDGSYSDDILSVTGVSDTYVQLVEGVEQHELFARRATFYDYFANSNELAPAIEDAIHVYFKTLLNNELIDKIVLKVPKEQIGDIEVVGWYTDRIRSEPSIYSTTYCYKEFSLSEGGFGNSVRLKRKGVQKFVDSHKYIQFGSFLDFPLLLLDIEDAQYVNTLLNECGKITEQCISAVDEFENFLKKAINDEEKQRRSLELLNRVRANINRVLPCLDANSLTGRIKSEKEKGNPEQDANIGPNDMMSFLPQSKNAQTRKTFFGSAKGTVPPRFSPFSKSNFQENEDYEEE
ncbi:hypothetical protein AALB53_16425 [Lachnospiraceae bacterium 47-T17]